MARLHVGPSVTQQLTDSFTTQYAVDIYVSRVDKITNTKPIIYR